MNYETYSNIFMTQKGLICNGIEIQQNKNYNNIMKMKKLTENISFHKRTQMFN
jgi:hypothetical protein